MTDIECVRFLQWCLPRMRFRWAGFRRVRRQVCKRLKRRIGELGLDDLPAYESFLEAHPDEWRTLDAMCRITVTRFHRDPRVWHALRSEVLPRLEREARARGERELRCWSAGCGSGEEPYTLNIVWRLGPARQERGLPLRITATDADERLIERAQRGVYKGTNLRTCPPDWVGIAFTSTPEGYAIREPFKEGVEFAVQDVRFGPPDGPFHLVLCRNLVFTYFDDDLQREVLEILEAGTVSSGCLVVGTHEALPRVSHAFEPVEGAPGIFSKRT